MELFDERFVVFSQDERERKMKNMEERMREIELSLHNVKLLLKEKVTQLKEQVSSMERREECRCSHMLCSRITSRLDTKSRRTGTFTETLL